MKSQQPTYIQLDPGEDVPSVRDRLSFIRGQRVLLIWPEDGTALTRKLDLVLVQREARRRVIQLALVTHDETVIEHADDLGISTFETIHEAENMRWKRGRTRVFINRYHKPDESPEPDDLMPVASRVRNPSKRLSAPLQLTLRLGVLSVVLGVLLGMLYVIVPSAIVSFALEQELIQVETTITADPNVLDVDVENRIIPAARYEATVQTVQQIEPTGSERDTSIRAIGVVTFDNLTDTPIVVPIGTQLSTSTGRNVIFETTALATVPANGRVDSVAIIASDEYAGEGGNVAASSINTVLGDLSDSLTVINSVPTTGGVDQNYQTVTPEDMDRVMGDARQYLQGLAFSEISSELGENQTIIIESLNIPEDRLRSDWITYSHEAGERTSLLTLDIRVIVEALVIDDRFAQQIIFAQLSSEKPPQMTLSPESFLYLRGPVIQTDRDNRTTFEAMGEGIASAQVDTYRLQNDLTRRSLDDALRVIAATVDLAPNSQPTVTVTPSWFNQMPFLPIRIKIEIEGENG
ncbi:MAG: hypothetical protein ACFE0Q_20020 [Anaerolineae bacterium]